MVNGISADLTLSRCLQLLGISHGCDLTTPPVKKKRGPKPKLWLDDDKFNSIVAMKQGGKTYKEIGAQFGVTRQRIQQIVRAGHQPFMPEMSRCSECGSSGILHGHHVSYDPPVMKALCSACHMKVTTPKGTQRRVPIPGLKIFKSCATCGRPFGSYETQNRVTCSRKCQMARTNRVVCTCEICGNSFERRLSSWRRQGSKKDYCSRTCWSKRAATVSVECEFCLSKFEILARDYKFKTKHDRRIFCSRSCAFKGRGRPKSNGARAEK